MNLDQLEAMAKAAQDVCEEPQDWYEAEPVLHEGISALQDAQFIAACSPDLVLRLIAVARAARGALGLRDERVHIVTMERSAATRTEELLRNGEAAEQAWAALRSAIAELDAQQEQTNG